MIGIRGLRKLVKDVKIPFIHNLPHNPALLQQIIRNIRTNWLALGVKLQLQIFPKPRGVVVS